MPGVPAADPIVVARHLRKDYGARRAVVDLSLGVTAGECLGLLGPNGAGKTTTIKMVTCYATPTAGELRVFGLPVTVANHAAIKKRLGIVQQEESLDPDLTVEKNLTVYASYFGIPRREAARRADGLIEFAELGDHRREQIRRLSGGMKRRLMLARALINEPSLLVLDEPTTGLDPQARRLVWERVRSLKRDGKTVLLTTHYMDEAQQLCDRLIIMDHGRIVAEGKPEDLSRGHVGVEVIEVHLNGGDHAALEQRLGSGAWRTERVGDVLYVYLPEGVAPPALNAAADFDVARRRATLEDVFLTLAGHAL